jgi:RHS repeat-associated protein
VFDGLGSVVGLTNSSGTLINTYSYDPYGTILSQTETVAQPYKFAGVYYDTEYSLYKMGARYYDPAVGRFTQADPITMPNPPKNGGWPWFIVLGRSGQTVLGMIGNVAFNPVEHNLYVYAGNDPVNSTDPTGLMPRWLRVVTGITLIVGGTVLIVATVVVAAHGGLVPCLMAVPVVYAEIGLVTEGINRVFGTKIPDLLPIFGP